MPENFSKKEPRTERENFRTIGAISGGAILGLSLFGPVGAICGIGLGVILGEAANYDHRNMDKKKKQNEC